jgi:hypothetical protein
MQLNRLGSFGFEGETISPDFRKVWDAFFAGQILVFRNQRLGATQFLDFARRFGRPEPHVIDQFHHADTDAADAGGDHHLPEIPLILPRLIAPELLK